MKRFGRILTGLLAALMFCPIPGARAEGLSFAEDGTFTVMIVSDAEELPRVSNYYTSAIQGVIQDYQPDLVVFMGDQLAGTNPLFALGDRADNVRTGIRGLLAPLVESGVPFAVMLGDQDMAAGLPLKAQLNVYTSYALCQNEASDTPETSVSRLGIPAYGGKSPILNLYLFNSVGTGAVDTEAIGWYRDESAAAKAENGGDSVPAVGFVHPIVPEIYHAFDGAEKGERGAFEGRGASEDQYYQKDSDGILLGEVNEAPETSVKNNGLFDAFLDQGDVFALFAGGDHRNTFLTALNGVDLVAMPAATYMGANSRETRGVRLVRFNEVNVRDYELIFVPFSNYEKLNFFNVIPFYLSTTTGISSTAKVAILAGVFVGAAALMFILDGRRKGGIPAPYDDGKEDIPLETDKAGNGGQEQDEQKADKSKE